VLATAAVVLAGLVAVAGLSLVTVERSTRGNATQREHVQAIHAAEAGVVAASAFLRAHLEAGSKWSAYVLPPVGGEPAGVVPSGIKGNGAVPGALENPFAAAANAWYEVTLFNNPADPGFDAGQDQDAVIVIRSIGHGPDGARTVLEVEVVGTTPGSPVKPRTWREILQ